MRSFRHWSIRYIICRINEIIYQKMYPEDPWITKDANLILDSFLKKSDEGLELGSGRSTVWFAKRVSKLTSIEESLEWHDLISLKLKENNLSNVNYLFFDRNKYGLEEQERECLKFFNLFQKESLDFALVDGNWRELCCNTLLDYIKIGGILILDNANYYLPSKSMSPMSRSLEQGPKSKEWVDFLSAVYNWRCIWTSSGVSDTAIYIKPCNR